MSQTYIANSCIFFVFLLKIFNFCEIALGTWKDILFLTLVRYTNYGRKLFN